MEIEHITKWVNGDIQAASMLTLIFEASQVADDIVDGDAKDLHEAMARLLSISFVELPSNPFFEKHKIQFIPLFATSIQIWSLTDKWGKSDNEEQQLFGFIYREILEQCVVMAAYITGGQKHARIVADEMNDFYRITDTDQDKLADWLKEQKS